MQRFCRRKNEKRQGQGEGRGGFLGVYLLPEANILIFFCMRSNGELDGWVCRRGQGYN